jgi:hypothetical protein
MPTDVVRCYCIASKRPNKQIVLITYIYIYIGRYGGLVTDWLVENVTPDLTLYRMMLGVRVIGFMVLNATFNNISVK